MGLTYLHLEVGNPNDLTISQNLRFLVDSGATNSVVPRRILEDIGIRPTASQQCQLANGQIVTREKGYAFFKFRKHAGFSSVLFGEEGDTTLLGVVTLEELGLMVDPVNHDLKPLPMLL